MPATTRRRTRRQPEHSFKPVRFEVEAPAPGFYRADLEFHGVDHSGASFEARVFLNNPDATDATGTDAAHGYVGSFFVFGHGGCFGDLGHCDVPSGPRRAFDLRPQHQLTPIDARLVATEAIKGAIEKGQGTHLTVMVVPVIDRADLGDYVNQELLKDPLKVEQVALLTYL